MATTLAAMRMPWWAWIWPLVGWALLAAAAAGGGGAILVLASALALIATVFASVYHAEVVAHRVGEPFGTLILAFAVTVIEVALIVSIMLSGGTDTVTLARDTVFATVMIICNGMVGICLLVGGVRHHEQGFQVQGASAALAVLAVLTVLTLILPNFTTSSPGPSYTVPQLAFESTVSLVLYGTFVFAQTVKHRDYFLAEGDDEDAHAPSPPRRAALASAGLLFVSLVAVVALAKKLSPVVEAAVAQAGAPRAVVGVVIAALVLMPEGLAAVRAAQANRLQTSLNLALGSALASIGLTIPAVAAASVLFDLPLALGLAPKEEVFLMVTIILGVITLGTGRTTVLQGMVHLVIFASFLFLAVVP
jgi:Ca2+:H+ antiporter